MKRVDNKFFQVSVKGLFFKDDKILMIKEDSGFWELPGGRIEPGEDFIECLKRECMEEMGLNCEVLEKHPSIIYPSVDKKGIGRIMIFFRINFNSLDFTPSEECREIKFCTKEEMVHLEIPPQMKKLLGLI